MGIELILATFKDESDEAGDSTGLRRLANAVRGTLRESGGTDEDADVSAEQIVVGLPGGGAEICSDDARFPIEELDPLTLRVIFEVARTGDMVVLTEGGDYSAIVVDPAQRSRLPYEEWQSESASPVCRSPEELGWLLESWYRVHAEFRNKAVADWRARSDANRQAVAPSSNVTRLRWDLVRKEFVLLKKDSEFVPLQQFDPAGNEIPRHAEVLRELREIGRRHLQLEDQPHSRLVDSDGWTPVSVQFPDYSASVWPSRALFNFYDLTPSIARLMFEVASTGDMSVLAPSTVILTDSGQAERLPHSWKQTKRIVSCESAEELRTLLMKFQVDIPSKERDYGFNYHHEYIPGTYPSRPIIVYIEAKPEEMAAEHQEKVYRHESQSPDGPRRPKRGIMMARFWRLETPGGRRFYVYDTATEGWLDILRDFASSEERMLGSIVNFETFVQDDGQQFPISDCEVLKVDSEDV